MWSGSFREEPGSAWLYRDSKTAVANAILCNFGFPFALYTV